MLNLKFLNFNMFTGGKEKGNPLSLNAIALHGEQTCQFIQAYNRSFTFEEIKTLPSIENATFDADTKLLGRFNNSLNVGNENLPSGENIVSWLAKRLNVRKNILEDIGTLGASSESVIDYSAVSGEEYIYEIFAKTENTIASPIISEIVKPDFYGYFLIDIATNEYMKFDIDLESSVFENVRDVSVQNTNSKYPTVSYGQADFYQGSVTCFGGEEDDSDENGVKFDVAYLEKVVDFLNRTGNKILKDRKGRGYLVSTSRASYKYRDAIPTQPFEITWDWREVGELRGRNIN